MSYFCKGSDSLICNLFQEQSYEISPYKGSDDEDEEEDDNIRDSKFVPSWARCDSKFIILNASATY